MAGETTNIMAMAEKVSSTLFSPFGWTTAGPANENFPCDKIEEHRKQSSPTHPTDVVFQYDDPYESKRKYILTDLKSYAKGSLVPGRFKGALRDLAKAVDCANISRTWRERYTNDSSDWRLYGMLFIYNHDNEFDRDFMTFFKDEATKELDLPPFTKIFVFGPNKIRYFMTILNDLKVLSADQHYPLFSKVPVFYPDRERRLAKQSTNSVARIELLMGPWQIFPYDFEPPLVDLTRQERKVGYIIYYERTGASSREFEFLFDFCFRNQMVKDGVKINVRLANGSSNSIQSFETAKENFAGNFYSSPDIKARLAQFSISQVQTTITHFSTEAIGMERRTYE